MKEKVIEILKNHIDTKEVDFDLIASEIEALYQAGTNKPDGDFNSDFGSDFAK
jgi:hypothetical protein